MSLLFECAHCSLVFPLYQAEYDFGELWCPRCDQYLRWKDGDLVSNRANPGKFVRDMSKEANLLIAVGKDLEVVVLEARGELVEQLWGMDDFKDHPLLRGAPLMRPGLFVYEGLVSIHNYEYPNRNHDWDYIDDLKASGGWALRVIGFGNLRRPTEEDGWECLHLEPRPKPKYHYRHLVDGVDEYAVELPDPDGPLHSLNFDGRSRVVIVSRLVLEALLGEKVQDDPEDT